MSVYCTKLGGNHNEAFILKDTLPEALFNCSELDTYSPSKKMRSQMYMIKE